ncbi:MAG: proton-conducting transporter membrane subunit [Gammaproteobacteria bacterium]|nr:proton-conducting transporter membrane subunit [Gammaproteobacteria bacterium]
MSMLLVLSWLVPLIAAVIAPLSYFWWLPAISAIPALVTAAMLPVGSQMEIPWLLLGTVLGMGDIDRIFLAFTSILWLAAGIYAAGSMRASAHGGRFRSYFLLAMAGNFWLIVGLDLVSFYVGFSIMGLASYGLVVHEGDRPALRAGKIYLTMTLLGELALFVALVLVAQHAGGLTPQRSELIGLGDLTVGLLIMGLAIKAGLVPVHVWLPLAHPAAPVPASAVLSGAMIKVALLGWLRFLPIGEVALVEWGVFMLMVGLLTLFYAIPIGLFQSNLKVILAYSSVSKIGLLALTLGLILMEPGLAQAGTVAICLYAAHHALVKGGLFLGVGLRHHARAQVLVLAGTAVLALSLAAVPPTGGAVAKFGIKPTLAGTDWSWLTAAVSLSTAGTALLMARFAWVVWRTEPHPAHGQLLAGIGWGGLVVLSLLYPILLGTPASWVTNAFPIGITVAIVAPVVLLTWRKRYVLRPAVDRVPAGDLISLLRPLLALISYASWTVSRGWGRLLQSGTRLLDAAVAAVGPAPKDPERGLRSWPNVGAVWLVVMALPLVSLMWTLPASAPWEQPRVAVEEPAMPPPRKHEAASRDDTVRHSPETDKATEQSPAEAVTPHKAAVSEPTRVATPTDSEVAEGPVPVPPSADEAAPAAPLELATGAEAKPLATLSGTAGETSTQASAAGGADEERCDPDQVLTFGHRNVARPLQLTPCIQGPDGPRRLAAPPLTNALVALVQWHLTDLGYDVGPLDGLIGPRTRRAIRAFQADQGDRDTGAISFRLLKRIVEVSRPASGEKAALRDKGRSLE